MRVSDHDHQETNLWQKQKSVVTGQEKNHISERAVSFYDW